MYVLCEKGRWQIENSGIGRTSTSNTGFAVSASVVCKSWVSDRQQDRRYGLKDQPYLC